MWLGAGWSSLPLKRLRKWLCCRYSRLRACVATGASSTASGTGTMTAGKFDAYASNTIQKNVARPGAFTVDV
jgi:hypothetical protein